MVSDVRGRLGYKQGVPNTIMAELEAESTTSSGELFHDSTCVVPNGTANGDVWSYGLEDLDWLVTRRTHRLGGSPSHGVCFTLKPSSRAIGVKPMTVDRVFRAIAHTANARNLFQAESPASGGVLEDQCPSVDTAWMASSSIGRTKLR